MSNQKPKAKIVKGVSMRPERWDKLRRIADEEKLVGGVSAIVDDAVTLWMLQYAGFTEGSEWILKRRIPVAKPEEDDEV